MKTKTAMVLAIGFVSLLYGGAHQFWYPEQDWTPMDLLYALMVSLLLFVWYRVDSSERNFRRTYGLNVAMVAFSFMALIYYLFRSRGGRSGARATFVVVLGWLGCVALMGIGGTAVSVVQLVVPARSVTMLTIPSPRDELNADVPDLSVPWPKKTDGELCFGKTTVMALVDTSGNVKEIKVESSSGYGALDEAALGAVRRWHFTPVQRHGAPVESYFRVPINMVSSSMTASRFRAAPLPQ
nr:energy transducer TonB [Dyella soli]